MANVTGNFSSRIGYVLAAAGSAVGLGNIWRFPYLAAKHGGGIFLLTYLILVLTFGYALLIAENGIGRMTGRGPIGAYRKLCNRKTSFLGSIRFGGWINAIVPLIIVPYYCVIGGWVTKFTVALCTNPIANFSKDSTGMHGGASMSYSAAYFLNFIRSTGEPIIYFLIFMAILVAVVALGVEKGIERFNKILMPVLFLLIVGICIYCAFLPNSGAGFKYYLKPELSRFSFMTVVDAMGQLFFSLSIAMGIMITYGSYMRKKDDLVSNVNQVEFFDTMAAFLAGMMIIPAVVAFGGEEAAQSAGVGLVFITMPQVFASFPGGQYVGVIFFVLVLFAAATSAISLLETNVQTIAQEMRISRKKAIICNVIEIICIGVITVLGYSVFSNFHPLAFLPGRESYDILDTLDFVSNNVMMPLAAVFTTILVMAVIGIEKFTNEIKSNKKWYREYIFQLCMTVIVIPCLILILLSSVGIINDKKEFTADSVASVTRGTDADKHEVAQIQFMEKKNNRAVQSYKMSVAAADFPAMVRSMQIFVAENYRLGQWIPAAEKEIVDKAKAADAAAAEEEIVVEVKTEAPA